MRSINGGRPTADRALRIASGDPALLAGFEQDDYVRTAHGADRMLDNLRHDRVKKW